MAVRQGSQQVVKNGEVDVVIETDVDEALEAVELLEGTELEIERPLPILPIKFGISGLYEHNVRVVFPQRPRIPIRPIPEPIPRPAPGPIPPRPWPGPDPVPRADALSPILPLVISEQLRLDVDSRYPQRVASGTARAGFKSVVHWIANLTKTASGYAGTIFYKDGNTASFPYTDVAISVSGFLPGARTATAKFTGGGATARVTTFKYKSPYHHPVDFEFDCATGVVPTLQINTGAHPNRPATLTVEDLSVQTVFKRAGFDVTTSPGGPVPISGAGSNATWSDQEMHDAMQTYWSRFHSYAQWAMWTFFASLHDQGTSLGGIMFDDIGAQHRQGTSIFVDSFIKNAPGGDPNPNAWVQRMIFWTVCHEMGHSFNLAHSWQKSLVYQGHGPWVPLSDEPEARSFMNYPYNVSGGQTAFFSDFEFRFSNQELLFMRHAPSRFVQMGNAEWFDHHGFEEANVSPEPTLTLEIRVNRDRALYEFLEPVNLELKLTNVASQPQLVDSNSLELDDQLTVVVKRDGRPARQLLPVVRRCALHDQVVVSPGESLYGSLLVSAGLKGWEIDEPGNYTIQVALQRDGEDIVSNELRIRVAPAKGYDEEYVAQELFTTDVARVLVLGGSEVMTEATETLREVVDRLPESAASIHAAIALGKPLARDYKQLSVDGSVEQPLAIRVRKAEPESAMTLLGSALTQSPGQAIETLGHIPYRAETEQLASFLAERGGQDEAAAVADVLLETLSSRRVRGRRVLESVLDEVRQAREAYAGRS